MSNETSSMKANIPIRLLPTIGSALGMLVLGIVGALLGSVLGNELQTCLLAGIGMILGSILGTRLSYRWLRHRV